MFKKVVALAATGLVSAAFALPVENMGTSGKTATELANAFVGSGITISNVTFKGTSQSAGTYTGLTVPAQGNSLLNNGIVLSSGSVEFLNSGSNTNDASTAQLGIGGDADLATLIPSYTINDATTLEFDFVAAGNAGADVTSSFWYVFGSEEYDEYVNSQFNDVFGFFLDDVNVATIPGSSTPVSINNVNAGKNATYYNDNDRTLGTPTPFATEMDGFTTPLYAEFTVKAGETHHLKLGIADAGDQILDSWVLLGGKTFTNVDHNNTAVPEPASMSLLAIGLLSLLGYGIRKRG